MAHTPGPYYLKEYDCGFEICRKWDVEVTPESTNTFGSCYGAHIARVKYTDGGVPTREQAEANARLIASAPDLLAALEEIAKGEGAFSLDPLTHAGNTIDNMKEIARAAIEKAKED